MSDVKDALGVAADRTRRLAASRQVRKDEIVAELDKRKRDRASLDGLPASAEATTLRGDLDTRIQELTAELATVTADFDAAQKELASLRKLAADQPAAEARAIVAAANERDPVLLTPEETALENARAHIQDLAARVKVNDELAEIEKKPEPHNEEPPTPLPTRPKKTL